MVILGIDAHKRTHTVVAIDGRGCQLGVKTTVATTTEAHPEPVRWADRFGTDRTWAVEDCRHRSRRLDADLLAAGEAMVRVPPKLISHARDSARWATRGADRVAELDQIGAYARLPEAVTRASRELADHGTVTRGGWEALRASLALGPLQALIDTMAG